MARVVLVELAPWDPATGQPVALKLAGGGRRHYTHRASTEWLGGVVTLPKVTTELPFSGTDFTGGAIPKAAAIGFNPSRPGARDRIAALMMIGAPVTVRVDNDDAADPAWPVTLAGTVADCSTSGGTLTITLSDLTGNLAKPLVIATFAGTGGLEGPAEAAGRVKRRSWGRCWNVEGLVLDKGNNVYEFGDPAFPLLAIDVVKDRGRAGTVQQLGWQGSAAATLATLAAAVVPSGGAVVAPSIACAKWFTTPSAPITADLRGEVGSGYVETVPAIAARIVAVAQGPAIGNLDAAIASRPDEAGWHVDNTNDTAATVLNGLLLKASLAWSIEASGTMTLSPIAFGAPVATLVASAIARQQSYPPVTSVEVGFRTNHRQHSDAEISAAVLSDVIQLTGDSPIETAIGDAGKTATEIVAPGAVIGGTKNPDGTISGGKPASVMIDDLDRVTDDLDVTRGDVEIVKTDVNILTPSVFDLAKLVQTNNAYLMARTTLEGKPIGTVVVDVRTVAESAVEDLSLIGAKNGPGTAFLLNMDTVWVSNGVSLTRQFEQTEANASEAIQALSTSVSQAMASAAQSVASQIATVQVKFTDDIGAATQSTLKAVTDGDHALSVRIDQGEANYGQFHSDYQTYQETVANQFQSTSQRIDTVETNFGQQISAATQTTMKALTDGDQALSGRIDAGNASFNQFSANFEDYRQGVASTLGATSQAIDTVKAEIEGDDGIAAQVSFLRSATVTPAGDALAKMVLSLKANGRIGGAIATNDGSLVTLDLDFDVIRMFKPDGTLMFVSGPAGEVYMPNVRVDKLVAGAINFEFTGDRQLLDPAGWYQEIPGGLIMMGGQYRASLNSESSVSILYPRPFPNQTLAYGSNGYNIDGNNRKDLSPQNTGQPSRFGASYYLQAPNDNAIALDGFDWWAWGE